MTEDREEVQVSRLTQRLKAYFIREFHKRNALLKTSWAFQTRQFFDNTSLHGVRYINEPNRPFFEKFMWFVFTSVGAIATMVVIVALWEKFQNNPTLTGLDTNYHSWDVKFPAITLCPVDPVDDKKVKQYQAKVWGNNTHSKYKKFLVDVANFSYYNIQNFKQHSEKINFSMDNLRDIQSQLVKNCEDIMSDCVYKGSHFNCCDRFLPFPTENGFCYSFNSRHAHTLQNGTISKSFKNEHIDEDDDNWMMGFKMTKFKGYTRSAPVRIYVHSAEEIPIVEFQPMHVWSHDVGTILFTDKESYTTSDSRQLNIKQRKCVFPEEIELETDSYYTFSGCMAQCRLLFASKQCGCIPFFYRHIDGYRYCDLEGLGCLAQSAQDASYVYNQMESIFSNTCKLAMFQVEGLDCQCTFACLNHVYELEKLQNMAKGQEDMLLIGFVSWPMVRYKKEVLFGWVDLLVSFGGIAGLFLGFSLLSGVECVYYFLLRSVCMTYRNVEELEDLQCEYDKKERDLLDLSLVPNFCRSEKHIQAKIKLENGLELPLILKPKTYHQIHIEEKFLGITDRIRYQE